MISTTNLISSPQVFYSTDTYSGASIKNLGSTPAASISPGQNPAKLLESTADLIDQIASRHIDFELSEDLNPVVSLKDFQTEIDTLDQNLRLLTSEQKPIPLTKLADRKNLHKLVSGLQYLNSTFLDEDHLLSVHSGDAKELKNTDSLTVQLFSILALNNNPEANRLTKSEQDIHGLKTDDSLIEETFLATQDKVLQDLEENPKEPILRKLAQASIAILVAVKNETSLFESFTEKSKAKIKESQDLLFNAAKGNPTLIEDLNFILGIQTKSKAEVSIEDKPIVQTPKPSLPKFKFKEITEIDTSEVEEPAEFSETDQLLSDLKQSIAEGKRRFSLPMSALNNTAAITSLLEKFSEHTERIFTGSSKKEADSLANKLMPLIFNTERNFLTQDQKSLFDRLNIKARKYIFSEDNKKNPRLNQLKRDIKSHARTSAYEITLPEDPRITGLSPKEVVDKLIMKPLAQKRAMKKLLTPTIASFKELAPINRLSRLTEKFGDLLSQRPKSVSGKALLLEQASKTISALDSSLKGKRFGTDLIPADQFVVLEELSKQLKDVHNSNRLREITTPHHISNLLNPNGAEDSVKAQALESFDTVFNPIKARIGTLALRVKMRVDQNRDSFITNDMRDQVKENLRFAIA